MKLNHYITRVGLVLLLAAAAIIAGCAKSYVDPTYKDASYDQLTASTAPVKVVLEFEFQTNGKKNNTAEKAVRPMLVDMLRDSRVVTPVEDTDQESGAGRLKITMNNVGDIGNAFAKGFGTGLTFGLIGSMVTDGYIFTAEYTPPGDENSISKSYEHALYTAIGNKSGPDGLESMSPAEAFRAVLEDLVIVYLKDLQKDGYLAKVEILHSKHLMTFAYLTIE